MSDEIKNVSETETEKRKAKVRYLYTKWFTGIEDMKYAENGRINIENEINKYIRCLEEQGKMIVGITPHNFGVSPINLVYNIICEEKSEKRNTHRFVRMVAFSSTSSFKNKDDSVSERVNATIDRLVADGATNIIAIVPHNFGVRPINLLYNIIYEAEKEL